MTSVSSIGTGRECGTSNRTSNEKGIAFVQILIISVTLVVVAVPEGMSIFHFAPLRHTAVAHTRRPRAYMRMRCGLAGY